MTKNQLVVASFFFCLKEEIRRSDNTDHYHITMATPTDEKKWKSICTEVTTFMTTATPIEKQKLLIGIAKMNTRRYVHERNGRFQARISAFLKVRTIGSFPNREEATLAVAIVKMKLGPELGLKKRAGQYRKSEGQKLKESVPQPKRKNRKSEAQKLKESVRVNTIYLLSMFVIQFIILS